VTVGIWLRRRAVYSRIVGLCHRHEGTRETRSGTFTSDPEGPRGGMLDQSKNSYLSSCICFRGNGTDDDKNKNEPDSFDRSNNDSSYRDGCHFSRLSRRIRAHPCITIIEHVPVFPRPAEGTYARRVALNMDLLENYVLFLSPEPGGIPPIPLCLLHRANFTWKGRACARVGRQRNGGSVERTGGSRARARAWGGAGRAVGTEGDAGQQLDEEVNMRQVSVRV
jgi:hypothetical protein